MLGWWSWATARMLRRNRSGRPCGGGRLAEPPTKLSEVISATRLRHASHSATCSLTALAGRSCPASQAVRLKRLVGRMYGRWGFHHGLLQGSGERIKNSLSHG